VPTLSACFIVGNENRDGLVRLALRQAKRVADEVIVVDSSDDGTGDVCREEGATVHYHPWPGDFSVQRNIALGYCRCEWILSIDADELIDDLFVEQWPAEEPKYNGYALPTYNFVRVPGEPVMIRKAEGTEAPWYPDYHIRVFKNDPYTYYRGGLHEGLVIAGNLPVAPWHIYHYGWARDTAILEARIARRNAEELASGGSGIHTLAEPYSDREAFAGQHPAIFDESYMTLRP
jgi:glycosyltransferase involved in cell wall biosynthesis